MSTTGYASLDSMSALKHDLPPHLPSTAHPTITVEAVSPKLDISNRVSHHNHTPSGTFGSNRSRRSFANLAKEKTSTALANLTHIGNVPPPLRTANSSASLGKSSLLPSPSRPSFPRSPTSPEVSRPRRSEAAESDMSEGAGNRGKMHQTSSKILRMTDDDRPFTRDFKDLFSTLITSLPLTPHRVRFSRVDSTFLSEEAITNLGSLKFSQSNRIPDPKNPSRWVVTTTTTTFSMAKEMARAVCQRFVDARFIESAESNTHTTFVAKGEVWQLTAKGRAVLSRFCVRNGIDARHIDPLVRREQMQIIALERDDGTDKLIQDKSTVEVIFRRFIGQGGPNIKSSTQAADSDSLSDYASGLVGVKMAKERSVLGKIVAHTFTGKAASDWLMDCCTTIDRRETYAIAELFVKWQLMQPVIEDRNYTRMNPMSAYFQPTKYAIYTLSERGQRVCGWLARPPSVSSEDSRDTKEKVRVPKDSNINRLNSILQDSALRLLFKEFLHQSLCAENLNFYLDVRDFTASYRMLEKSGKLDRPDSVRETLAAAYGLYNSFLASGAPSELNIDHSLRNKLDSRMIRTDNDDMSMRQSLDEVVELFEHAQNSVFKLMASDSVPKFVRDPRYASVLREHEFDISNSVNRAFSPAPTEKTVSRSNTSRA